MKTGTQMQWIVRSMKQRWEKDAVRLRDMGFAYDGARSDPVSETLRNLDTAIVELGAVLTMTPSRLEELTAASPRET